MAIPDERLIQLEMDAIYGLEYAGGSIPKIHKQDIKVLIAWTPNATLLALGRSVTVTERALLQVSDSYREEQPPQIIRLLAEQLFDDSEAAPGQASFQGGPLFVVPRNLTPPAVNYPVVTSDVRGRQIARSFYRPDNWEADEWQELVSGELGPWAMATDQNQPISICHTSASNEKAAEAGLWTREDFRGRGLGPATTVAWAKEAHITNQSVFYSTWADNVPSRAVARKVGLTPLGWKWIVP